MLRQSLAHTVKRYKSLYSEEIKVLPIATIMPHGACNCKCVMCDIWKGNKNAKQLEEEDIIDILTSLKMLETKRIAMSGGEALLNRNFFRFCELIKKNDIKISLLSTGLTLGLHAEKIISLVDGVIVSLDGDEELHNSIRNINGAFQKLKEGIQRIKSIDKNYPISGRCVIHQLNYKNWDKIIIAAKEIGLDSISFLPADVSSHAFNREMSWDLSKQESLLIPFEDLPVLKKMIKNIFHSFKSDFETRFIAESPERLEKIYQYYAAHHNLLPFPYKRCNAPWVSAVIEADGTVRPCFFLEPLGSIKTDSLHNILNSKSSIQFRKGMDINTNPTCIKCVCYLNLDPGNSKY
ncbi:MAG TPA: radical SAM protein [Saprospiraceae bacterium]|nr:radical SAM protein [Saprospiraceae bacterium]